MPLSSTSGHEIQTRAAQETASRTQQFPGMEGMRQLLTPPYPGEPQPKMPSGCLTYGSCPSCCPKGLSGGSFSWQLRACVRVRHPEFGHVSPSYAAFGGGGLACTHRFIFVFVVLVKWNPGWFLPRRILPQFGEYFLPPSSPVMSSDFALCLAWCPLVAPLSTSQSVTRQPHIGTESTCTHRCDQNALFSPMPLKYIPKRREKNRTPPCQTRSGCLGVCLGSRLRLSQSRSTFHMLGLVRTPMHVYHQQGGECADNTHSERV